MTTNWKPKSTVTLVLILSALFLIAASIWLFPNAIVDGDSMNPTYHDGDFLIGRRFGQINRNDVVVVSHSQTLIKRIIGLPGETIRLSGDGITIDGVPYTEDYEYNMPMNGYEEAEYVLSDDEFFILGDNRDHSADSRYFGPVKRSEILFVITGHNSFLEWIRNTFSIP